MLGRQLAMQIFKSDSITLMASQVTDLD